MQIQGAHILVTGGSLGIGKETARQLVEKGAKVVITGRSMARLEQAAQETGAIPLEFDIADLASIPQKAQECLDLLSGKIDVLINNAGIGNFPLLEEVRAEDFEQVFATNVFGLALLTQELIKPMRTQQSGTILNIGSSASLKGFARGTVYAASKFALRAMSQSWQAELRRDNIRVCHINPSEVTTAFNSSDRQERANEAKKLDASVIADILIDVIEMANKGFVQEMSIWATNPF